MDDAATGRILIGRGGRLQDHAAREEAGGIYDGGDSEADGGAPSEDVDPRCALVEALVFLFGWGILSLPNVVWIANCSIQAGAAHPDLTVLSRLGVLDYIQAIREGICSVIFVRVQRCRGQ